jgi:hypothetical protein
MGRVSHRAPWLAWSLCSCVLLLLALSASLIFLGWSTPLPPKQDPWWQQLARIVTFSGAPLLGGFIASRRPENAYGWVWLAFGFGLALLGFSQAYVSYALVVENGALPAPRTVDSVVGGIGWGATITFIPILLLLFPTGRPPSRRWRLLVWGVVGLGTALLVLAVLSSFGDRYVQALIGLLFLAEVPAALSLVFRYRSAGGLERQQIKWFAYAGFLFAVFPTLDMLWPGGLPENALFNTISETGTIIGLYVAIGVAISRHRLYDIDVIINRTLVYASLTVTLAALYIGGIIVLQRVFVVVTGERSTLAVVASTLAIAALFNPLRKRVQAFVDRRFYRRKYDAAKTIDAFSARLRDETDLEALSDELVGVVRQTMQPAHASLWLRPYRANAKDNVPS